MLTIYTDGGCTNNQASAVDKANGTAKCYGAFCAILVEDEQILRTVSGERSIILGGAPTNNQMELLAAYAGIHAALKLGKLRIHLVADSAYVVDNIPRLKGWEKRGWKTKDRKPIANLEMWQEFLKLLETSDLSLTVERVPGHSGHSWNDKCDAICNQHLAKYR